jgi:hypothetical protein
MCTCTCVVVCPLRWQGAQSAASVDSFAPASGSASVAPGVTLPRIASRYDSGDTVDPEADAESAPDVSRFVMQTPMDSRREGDDLEGTRASVTAELTPMPTVQLFLCVDFMLFLRRAGTSRFALLCLDLMVLCYHRLRLPCSPLP